MNLKEIVNKNKEVNEWYKNIEKQKEDKKKEIELINSEINTGDVKALEYDKAKEILQILKDNLTYNQLKDFKNILKELKIKKYPILNKAHYYPIINQIDFLNDKQKHDLDEVLYHFETKMIVQESRLWESLHYNKEAENKIFDFLYNNKIVKKTYIIYGSDEFENTIVSEEQYNNFIKYHSVTKEEKENMTNEEYNNYENRWGNEGYFAVDTDEGYLEIYTIKDLKKYAKPYYYELVAKADYSLDNI